MGLVLALELKGIGKKVAGEVHIHPTDLTLAPGSFNILLGTTLAGKTTLMQLMAGLEKPTAGEIWFNGRNVTGVAVQRRNVSMVYQQFINYPNMTVFENIASPLRVAGLARDEIKRRVGTMAELMKISAMLDRRPAELSGGQQQRCAMARALVKDSDLVLLDEPLANLDYKLREELRDELPRIFAKRDCVVVYATTEPAEALLFGGHTATLFEGAVVDFGVTGDVYRNPANLTAAKVFSEPPINTVEVTKKGDRIVLTDGIGWPADPAAPDGSYTLAIRAHHVLPEVAAAGYVPIAGRVHVAELSGSESMIHFEAFGRPWASLSHGVHPFESGEAATLYADMAHAFYFDAAGRPVALTAPAGAN